MSLYKKYRPKTLAEFHATKSFIESLEAVLAEPKTIPHALLFTGNSGTGKTTLARIVKTTLGCHDLDYRELDTAVYRSIDDVREIRKNMQLSPIAGPVSVYLLDEVHSLGVGGDSAKNAAQNALLKALEDMPPHVYFILATTEPQMLIKTIRTRCMEFNLPSFTSRQTVKLLKEIAIKEKKGDNVSDEILEQISKESLGSPRAAIVTLEKVIDLSAHQQTKAVERSISEENQAIELCRAMISTGVTWDKVRTIISGLQEQQPESVRRMVLGYAQAVLLKSDNLKAFAVIREFEKPVYDGGWPMLTGYCYAVTDLNK